jgi:hypothetical protein
MDALINAFIFATVIMLAGGVITGAFFFILYLAGFYDD